MMANVSFRPEISGPDVDGRSLNLASASRYVCEAGGTREGNAMEIGSLMRFGATTVANSRNMILISFSD